MTQVVDLYVLYKFIKAISTPFDETDAFRLGIIDEKGKLLKSPKTQDEKEAYDPFDRTVFNIKRILQRVGLDKRYATYTGALLLMKESANDFPDKTDIEIERGLYEQYKYLKENTGKTFRQMHDEMTATGAAVAGTGDDPVHWGKPRGRPRVLGRTIDGLAYLKRRRSPVANTVASSYPRGMAKLENK